MSSANDFKATTSDEIPFDESQQIADDDDGGVVEGGLSSVPPDETLKKGSNNAVQNVAGIGKSAGKAVVAPVERALHLKGASANGDNGADDDDGGVVEGGLSSVPPDETLKKMDIIISKRLKGLTIEQFHDTVWAEHEETPLYTKWLESSGKKEVTIQDWKTEPATGPWDGESYDKHRTANFRFTRTTHLYTGPPIAEVKHTQFCKLTEDKCVLGMQIEMQGIPFADCFNVQIRWVATRMGTEKDLEIQVGLFVNFVKQTVLAGKIRSGTSEEATKTQLSLFQSIKEACSKVAGGALEEGDDGDDVVLGYDDHIEAGCFQFNHLLLQWFGKHRNDTVSKQAKSAESKLKKMQDVWDSLEQDDGTDHVVESELTDIHASLDIILKQLEANRKK